MKSRVAYQGRSITVALDEVELELTARGLAADWPLGSSLRYFRDQWERHARRESCPEGLCLETKPAPCHGTCPADIDIPSFVAHIGHGDYRSAIEVIRRDNPLPLTCGLVCPAPCESACVRGESDGAVFIRPMKAKAAEHCLAEGGYPRPDVADDTGKRIGIVGSGPAGLTAAYYLRTLGHQVEIFEAQEKAGGMLRYGIPAYRLPPDLLEQELDQIRVLGIPIHTGAAIGSLEAFKSDYDAVFLGLGTQQAHVHQPLPDARSRSTHLAHHGFRPCEVRGQGRHHTAAEIEERGVAPADGPHRLVGADGQDGIGRPPDRRRHVALSGARLDDAIDRDDVLVGHGADLPGTLRSPATMRTLSQFSGGGSGQE